MFKAFNPLPMGHMPLNREPHLRRKYTDNKGLIADFPPLFILCKTDAVSPFMDDADFFRHLLHFHEDKLSFLGLWGKQSFWAVDGENIDISALAAFEWCHPRLLELSLEKTGLVAASFGLAHWHRNHGFCSRCGQPAKPILLGEARQCISKDCSHIIYPRIDPAMITLVIHPQGEKALLIEMHPRPHIYTTVSGFVSIGETIEECVKREVKEETHIDVSHVTYRASQPWPFPQSLMIGCYAKATSTKIIIEKEELNDAKWFSKAEIIALRQQNKLPPCEAISRHLIEEWLSL